MPGTRSLNSRTASRCFADRLAVLARRSREAGLDGAQKAALRSRVDQDAAAAVQEHTRWHFRLAA
ncbi:MAG: hypothetical protein QOH19_2277 [Actinomycetota bacterium]|nr:hypothetical protein [Actinomycetota bacterium]